MEVNTYTGAYSQIISTLQVNDYLVFTFDNDTQIKFGNNGFVMPEVQKFVTGTKSGLPELHLTQGIKSLIIVYPDESTLDTDWAVIEPLIVVSASVTATIDPPSISTLATLAEQESQTALLEEIFSNLENTYVSFNNGNFKIRLNSTADNVTTDSNVRSAGSYQTNNFFSCQLTVLTGTMTIDGVTYPQTTASGNYIDSVTFEAPAGWQHFDFTYTVNASSTVLEIITKAL